jgi:hypothetical protein
VLLVHGMIVTIFRPAFLTHLARQVLVVGIASLNAENYHCCYHHHHRHSRLGELPSQGPSAVAMDTYNRVFMPNRMGGLGIRSLLKSKYFESIGLVARLLDSGHFIGELAHRALRLAVDHPFDRPTSLFRRVAASIPMKNEFLDVSIVYIGASVIPDIKMSYLHEKSDAGGCGEWRETKYSYFQKVAMHACDRQIFNRLLTSEREDRDRHSAILQSAATKSASSFLSTTPGPRTAVEDGVFNYYIHHLLGLQTTPWEIMPDMKCSIPSCHSTVTPGHERWCKGANREMNRHMNVEFELARFLSKAGVAVEREKFISGPQAGTFDTEALSGYHRTHSYTAAQGVRMDIVACIPGHRLTYHLDVTVVELVNPSNISQSKNHQRLVKAELKRIL